MAYILSACVLSFMFAFVAQYNDAVFIIRFHHHHIEKSSALQMYTYNVFPCCRYVSAQFNLPANKLCCAFPYLV